MYYFLSPVIFINVEMCLPLSPYLTDIYIPQQMRTVNMLYFVHPSVVPETSITS